MKKFNFSTSLFVVVLLMTSNAFGQISGTVFNDFNGNGIQDLPQEIGFEGVTITGYGADGTTYGPVVSTTSGSYTLAGVSQATRVEFSWTFDWLYPSMAGTTRVQFVPAAANDINLGVIYHKQYCPDLSTVSLATPCYINGDAINGDPATAGDASGFDAWVQLPYNSSGVNSGSDVHWANMKQVGALYGEAYQSSTESLFASAFVRRHVGLGSIDGTNTTTGGIYAVDVDGADFTAQAWLDVNTLAGVNTGADPRVEEGSTLPLQADQPSHDVLAFSQVGRRGLGDLEISDDESTLYTINLFDKTILEIDIATKSLKQAPIMIADPGCVNGEDIPFALGYHKGELYVGSICNGINSTFTGNLGDTYSDLHLYVRKLNGTSLDPVIDFPLDFERGGTPWSHPLFDDVSGNDAVATWQPWVDNWADLETRKIGPGVYAYPSPLFTDIEFDTDGSMILGVTDRSGLQGGFFNYPADISSTSLFENISAGDVYRVCMVNGSYVLEGNAGCVTAGSANGEGPNGGEYYFEDWYPNEPETHEEISWGALALCAGTGEVAMTGYDAFQAIRSGGVHFLNNADGTHSDGYEIWGYIETGSPLFGKAQGLGDLELVYPPAPIEIGNRIWKDTDLDGVQDADEVGIDGVEIELVEAGSVIATATSANGGEWYFNDANVPDGLKPDTDYTIRVKTALDAGALAGCTAFAIKDASTGGAQDLADSDAASDGTIIYRTGRIGNNHTLDIGVAEAVACVNPEAGDDAEICQPKSTLKLKDAPAGTEWVAAAGNTATIDAATGAITGMTDIGTYTFTLRDVADNSCSDDIIITVTANTPNLLCNDGSTSITATAEADFTDVIWFNSAGTQVGTGTSLIIDSNVAGLEDGNDWFYYTAKDTNDCDIELCCPVVVITEDCCPTPKCVGVTVIKN